MIKIRDLGEGEAGDQKGWGGWQEEVSWLPGLGGAGSALDGPGSRF
jgi:hypothetical protein